MGRCATSIFAFLLLLHVSADGSQSMGSTLGCLGQAEKVFDVEVKDFEETMEPWHLEAGRKVIANVVDRDQQGNIYPEVRQAKLNALFRLFRIATDSIDVAYIPSWYAASDSDGIKCDDSYKPKMGKIKMSMFYDAFQSGLRAFRFLLRSNILTYIGEVYGSTPSESERREVLALADGVDSEFISLLDEAMKMGDVLKIGEKEKMKDERWKRDEEAFLESVKLCMKKMNLLFHVRGRDCLFYPDDESRRSVSLCGVNYSGCIMGLSEEEERQHNAAQEEYGRQSQAVGLWRDLQDMEWEVERQFFKLFRLSDFLNTENMEMLQQFAREAGMKARFVDNMKESIDMKEIDFKVKLFEKGKERGVLDVVSSMIEELQVYKGDRMRGREFHDNFRLERWLRLFHVVNSNPDFPERKEVKEVLETKIMAHIDQEYTKYRSKLVDARWWMGAYGMEKSLIEKVDQLIAKMLEDEKREIEKELSDLNQNFNLSRWNNLRFKLYYFFYCKKSRSQPIQEILEVKIRYQLMLIRLLEKYMDPTFVFSEDAQDSSKAPLRMFKMGSKDIVTSFDQEIQLELHREHESFFREQMGYDMNIVYVKKVQWREGLFRLMRSMDVISEFIETVRARFKEEDNKERK